MADLQRPIVVVGAPRSGTTLLADTLLSTHPEIAYWHEPIFIWRYGNAYRRHDIRWADDATPKVKDYICRAFEEYRVRHGAPPRFMEKTPSNCLRLPFVLEVFPDAQIVHIIRDGRDAVQSIAREWGGLGKPALEYRHLREGGPLKQAWTGLRTWLRLRERVNDVRSLLELPAYAGRLGSFLARQLLKTDRSLWGPRFPGLREMRRSFSLLETCAVQWDLCVRLARSVARRIESSAYLEIRYESLITDPATELDKIFASLELRHADTLIPEMAERVVSRELWTWRDGLHPQELQRVEDVIGETLRSLGYPLDRADRSLQKGAFSGP